MKNTMTGHNIKKVREIKNISQDYVARHLGITQAAYSNIERGKTKIDQQKLARIADALNVVTDVILKFDADIALNACLKSKPSKFRVKKGDSF